MKEGNSSTPFISVILPFHNAPTLATAVKSILDQSYQHFELLLIDNASTDVSKEVAVRLAKSDKRIQLIKEPQKGVVFAVNKGIRQAKGEFIMRMDADDYSFPDRMLLQLKTFQEDHELGVVSGKIEYHGDITNVGFIEYIDWLNTINSPNEIALNRFIEFPMANPSMMFKKELFNRYGLYKEGNFPEDYEFFLRLQSEHIKMTKIEEPVLRWIDSDQRLTRTDNRYSTDSFYKIKSFYLADWLKKNNPFHPRIYVWGGGRLSKRRSDYLREYGIEIVKYIDVKPRENTIHFENIPSKNNAFIVSYVGNRGARDKIRRYLQNREFKEGNNYIIAS